MILIFSLFVVGRHHEVLLWAAARRAIELEVDLKIKLTTTIKATVDRSLVHSWGMYLYTLFILGSFSASTFTTITLGHLVHPQEDAFSCLVYLVLMLCLATFFWSWGYRYHLKTKEPVVPATSPAE
jgi:hypothetical protein